MSGMFYPWTVTVERAEGVLSGCGGEPVSLLLGAQWVVESIAGAGIIGRLARDGRVPRGRTSRRQRVVQRVQRRVPSDGRGALDRRGRIDDDGLRSRR